MTVDEVLNQSNLCHPDRSVPRISYCAALTVASYAAFRKESRMKFANATKLDRKSGGSEVEGSAVRSTFRTGRPKEDALPVT